MSEGLLVFIISLAVLIGIPAIFAKITGEPTDFILSLYLTVLAATVALLIACTYKVPVGK